MGCKGGKISRLNKVLCVLGLQEKISSLEISLNEVLTLPHSYHSCLYTFSGAFSEVHWSLFGKVGCINFGIHVVGSNQIWWDFMSEVGNGSTLVQIGGMM